MPHVHNGLHEYARLLDAAARAIGEKSGAQDFTGIERFGETLTPIMNLWELPEWALLRGEVLYGRRFTVGADAATFSSLEVVNPTGSPVLAVVLEILSTVSTIEVGVDSGAALGAVATVQGVAHDTRFPALGETSRCLLTTGHLAAGLSLPMDFVVSGTRTVRPYILRPGQKLFLSTQAINVQLTGSLFWTERPFLPTENRA